MRLPVAAALCALLFVGCSRCGKSAGGAAADGLEHLLPPDADLLVVLQDLQKLGTKVTQLQGLKVISFAAQLQGLPTGANFASALFAQVGIDPRSKESLEAAGIDPAKGAGFALRSATQQGYSQGYSVVGVKDEGKLRAFLARLARNRLGAPVSGSQDVGGVAINVFSRSVGAAPALGYRFAEGYALIAPAGALELLAAAGRSPSLADDHLFLEGQRSLSKTRDATLYLPAASPLLPDRALGGVVASVEVAGSGLSFAFHAPLRRPEAAALFEGKAAPALQGLLPKDAFAVVRYRGDPANLKVLWPRLAGPYVAKAFEDAQFDVGAELFDNLRPGAVAAIALSPNVSLASGMPQLDVRRTNPFRFVNLLAAAEVKDPAKAAATLEKLPPIAARFGAKLTPTERSGKKVYEASYAQGEGTHVALLGDKVFLAAPMARLDQALASADAPSTSVVAPELAAALEQPTFGLVVDFQKLAASVRLLPDSAWGLGGFAMKASTLRWLDGLSDLRGLTLTARGADGAIDGELTLRFTAP